MNVGKVMTHCTRVTNMTDTPDGTDETLFITLLIWYSIFIYELLN